MPTVLITGVDCGVGPELARQYADEGWNVIGTRAVMQAATGLTEAKERLRAYSYDPGDDRSARALADVCAAQPIDVIIMNEATEAGRNRPLEALTADDWTGTLMANAYAPLHLATLLRGNLEAGQRKILVGISDMVASTSTNRSPDDILYRASKAALNQMWRNLAVEWRDWGCTCLLLCERPPEADIAGTSGLPLIAMAMRRVIANADQKLNGCFVDHEGKSIAW